MVSLAVVKTLRSDLCDVDREVYLRFLDACLPIVSRDVYDGGEIRRIEVAASQGSESDGYTGGIAGASVYNGVQAERARFGAVLFGGTHGERELKRLESGFGYSGGDGGTRSCATGRTFRDGEFASLGADDGSVDRGRDNGTESVFVGGNVKEHSRTVDGLVGSVGCGGSVSGCAPKVGKWRKKNLKKKEKRSAKVLEGSWRQETPVVVEKKSEAQETLEAKWVVENKLKAAEAKRKLQLLEMQDVIEVAKLQERKLKAAGERAMVQIEKSHATLAASGNVPGVVPKGGYCTTVLDDPGLSDGSSPTCTISPDSSASMQEFRELQKNNLDLVKENTDLKKLLTRREKAGKMNREESVAEFTANGSEVGLPASLCEVLENKCGQYEYEGLCDGKHVVRAVHDLHFGFEEGDDVVGVFDSY